MAIFRRAEGIREIQPVARPAEPTLDDKIRATDALAEKITNAMLLAARRPDIYDRIVANEGRPEALRIDLIAPAVGPNERDILDKARIAIDLAKKYPGELKSIKQLAERRPDDVESYRQTSHIIAAMLLGYSPLSSLAAEKRD